MGTDNSKGLKPGQKFPTPTPGYGDRVFYETLLQQRPESAMAQEWCVYYGVLPTKEAERLNTIVMERKRKIRLGGGTSTSTFSPSPKKKSSQQPAKKKQNVKKKRVVRVIKDEGYDDPDMIPSSSGEGMGVATL